MTNEVVITVVLGLIAVLFAFVYQKNRGLRLVIGSLGALLLIYGGFTYGTIQPIPYAETFDTGNKLQVIYPVERVQVISPVDKDTVKCRILTMGVYPESHNKDLWVLLKPSDGKYYPQSDYTNTSYKLNGEWQVVTRFGGDAGENYELIVVETDSIASQFFSNTIANWKSANDYVGLQVEQIPRTAVELERISVTLADNCRGTH
ncbi:hypothetical protein [Winogradskyella alexanderae]|uniref:DUF2892 domain-containing protein n=1 Tax=Winogradskyella alexanderae TaxID=2877123 RepID=A0ABS7XV96_9FLAO|nr:hypothetical protein [Winogradskyella alexanderae]MCA0132746.1 hypothetical protein [Winogradskyella alexanderae]